MRGRQEGRGYEQGGPYRPGGCPFTSLPEAAGLVRSSALTDQPSVDQLPFAPSPGLKVQEGRLLVLQLKIEFERVPARCLVRIDGLALQPAAPFGHHQSPRVLLLHPAVQTLLSPVKALTNALVRRRERNAISAHSLRRLELKPKPIELLLQPGGGAGLCGGQGGPGQPQRRDPAAAVISS